MSGCCDHHGRCLIPPSPELRARMREELSRFRANAAVTRSMLRAGQPQRPGMNDGVILPGSYFPAGTPLERVRGEALRRAPLRGAIRVVVVLVDFEDQPFDAEHDRRHFEDLFFSRGVLRDGSVREYFDEASHGVVDIVGEVVGPYRLPRTLAAYANGESGTGDAAPNARTMARDTAELANRDVNFSRYDNDGNGFVDAFVVIHAGRGGEATGDGGDIWSHKWVLPGGEYNADGTRIYAYLTVPEDARIGVCCHELGHLIFGWPDLYDTDGSSEGLGNWCLMAGGSWNGGGDVPAHPSAWCKAQQGWVTVVNQTVNGPVAIGDVKDTHTVYRLWQNGAAGREYFLVENRQRRRYDRLLPGDGLLVFHVDDGVDTNADERRPKVALMQADGNGDLSRGANRGDAGDAFPGPAGKVAFTATSTPSSRSYNNANTGVAITAIGPSGPVMTAHLAVRAAAAPPARPPRPRLPSWWLRLFGAPEAAAPLLDAARAELARDLLQELLRDPGEAAEAIEPAAYAAEDGWQAAVEARLAAIEAALAALAPPAAPAPGADYTVVSIDPGIPDR